MIIAKSIIFNGVFILSRIPFWFILYMVALSDTFRIPQAIVVLIMLSACKAFVNAELYNQSMIKYFTSVSIRTIVTLVVFIACYVGMIYYILFASEVTKLIVMGIAFIGVLLFYNTSDSVAKNRYIYYNTRFTTRLITSICWLYLIFANDSIIGNATIIIAIIIIELFHLHNNESYIEKKKSLAIF